MRSSRLTTRETRNLAEVKMFSIENGIEKGHFDLKDVGDLLPGAVMVHDLNALEISYMNKWGCEKLGHSLREINLLGEEYYTKFFLEEESRLFLPAMADFCQREDPAALHNFFHRVKTDDKREPGLYYAVCKLLRRPDDREKTNELVLVAHPVSGMGHMATTLSKVLEENTYATKNYEKFLALSKREKEIIRLLAEGHSSAKISDMLCISSHTVITHRKNISRKLDINNFAELIKFANAFNLISY